MDLQKEFSAIKKDISELKDLYLQNTILSNTISTSDWLDLQGLCEYLPDKPAHATIYFKLSQGLIPGHKRGKKWYFLREEINEWLKKGKVKTVSEIEAETEEQLSKIK